MKAPGANRMLVVYTGVVEVRQAGKSAALAICKSISVTDRDLPGQNGGTLSRRMAVAPHSLQCRWCIGVASRQVVLEASGAAYAVPCSRAPAGCGRAWPTCRGATSPSIPGHMAKRARRWPRLVRVAVPLATAYSRRGSRIVSVERE